MLNLDFKICEVCFLNGVGYLEGYGEFWSNPFWKKYKPTILAETLPNLVLNFANLALWYVVLGKSLSAHFPHLD